MALFFNNRLTFELAYWQKNSKDLVLEVPTAPTAGIPYNSYFDNIGKIKNSGMELTVNATIIATKDGTGKLISTSPQLRTR